jgi:Na+/melibiose symporter-like transporter
MNVQLFGQRVFTVGMFIIFLLMSSQAAFFLITAYFLQIGLGFTALKAGVIILPMGIGYLLSSLLSSKATTKLGTHVLTLGSVMTVVGYFLLGLSVHITEVSPNVLSWVPALIVLAIGIGLIGIVWLNTLGAHSGMVGQFKQNYTDAFVFCLYVLAVYTALLFPFVFIMIRRK